MSISTESFDKKISIENLADMEKKFIPEAQDSYLKTYKYFLEYFENLDQINESNAVIGISFVYSWMPRILKINFEKEILPSVVSILNKAKNSHDLNLTPEDFQKLQIFSNNSLVGASKFLHFINPSCFPIWDSNIARFFLGKFDQPTMSNISNYLQYRESILKFAKKKDFQPIFVNIKNKLKGKSFYSEITELRAIELLIFYSTRKR